ncbi:hypothetical protein NHQ30_007734 [Ciborinia camelliae]|nr:hypothetical protein NHQ30_007734 [Ciborinia camelliae]
MQLNQFSLLVFMTGSGLCEASLLRRNSEPSSTCITSTTLQTLTSSSSSPPNQPEVTPPPGMKVAQIAGIFSFFPKPKKSNGGSERSVKVNSASRAVSVSSDLTSSASSTLSSTTSESTISESTISESTSSESTSIKPSSSSKVPTVSASLVPAAAIAMNTAQSQSQAQAQEEAATESAGAISSQLGGANGAVQFSDATTIPMAVVVVLIIGTSFATSVMSVLVYRVVSRRRKRKGGEKDDEMKGEQNGNGNVNFGDGMEKGIQSGNEFYGGGMKNVIQSTNENYGGGMERGTQTYMDPDPATTSNYPPASNIRSDGPSVPTFTNPFPRPKYASRYRNSQNPEQANINRAYSESVYDRGSADEDNYSMYDIIDIEKEIAEMDFQMRMAEAELERRESENPIRLRESGLSGGSKSIGVPFTPGRVPLGNIEESEGENEVESERRVNGNESASPRNPIGLGMSVPVDERLNSSSVVVSPPRRQSQVLSPLSKPNSEISESSREIPISDKELEEPSRRHSQSLSPLSDPNPQTFESSREIPMSDRELEEEEEEAEGEEIPFTLDETPPTPPTPPPKALPTQTPARKPLPLPPPTPTQTQKLNPNSKHAYQKSDASVMTAMTLSPSVYDGSSGNWKKVVWEGKGKGNGNLGMGGGMGGGMRGGMGGEVNQLGDGSNWL